MGAESAEDLSYLQEKELQQLVESLGLPILKQRKLANKLLHALVDPASVLLERAKEHPSMQAGFG